MATAAEKAWDSRRGGPGRAEREAQRRDDIMRAAEAVCALVRHRDIKPGDPRWKDPGNDQELRYILSAIVRRWRRPVEFVSAGSYRKRKLHREHVVPVEIIVSQMIRKPNQIRALFKDAVIIAHVTPAEHAQLSNFQIRHPELYDKMLTAPVKQLARLGLKRYERSGIDLKPVVTAAA
jgi:hypothetical protein